MLRTFADLPIGAVFQIHPGSYVFIKISGKHYCMLQPSNVKYPTMHLGVMRNSCETRDLQVESSQWERI